MVLRLFFVVHRCISVLVLPARGPNFTGDHLGAAVAVSDELTEAVLRVLCELFNMDHTAVAVERAKSLGGRVITVNIYRAHLSDNLIFTCGVGPRGCPLCVAFGGLL